MRIRNLTASSLPAAMDLVRSQMGPDAVILSTESDPASGLVRITAALEEPDGEDTVVESFEQSIAGIDQISRALQHHRIPGALLDRLTGLASSHDLRDPAIALAGALDAELRFTSITAQSFARPLMLVGPPGAGKSSTAAKLCAHARLTGLASRIVTTDCLKAGAVSQITTYGKALGSEVVVAEDQGQLVGAVAARKTGELTVVDTVGVNPFESSELAELQAAARAAEAELVLVMPASGDALDAAEAAVAFAGIGVRSAIATKLDLARRLGSLISAVNASRLALMATGHSPHIVDGLRPVNPVSLARLLLGAAAPAAVSRGDLP